MVLRSSEAMILRAVDIPTPEHISGDCGPNVDMQYAIDHVVLMFDGLWISHVIWVRHDFQLNDTIPLDIGVFTLVVTDSAFPEHTGL